MGLRSDEESNPKSCLRKAAPNEPIFVLRAQDRIAPFAVRYWAAQAERWGAPREKVDEAIELAKAMENWPTRKNPD
jgi:hypothetical protein